MESASIGESKQKAPFCTGLKGAFNNLRQRHTIPQVNAVPSALMGLTSLFGMGRGGHHRYNHHKCRVQGMPANIFDI
jgi:hypothetical protein